jgi:tetratricopeptide (TPR) repeat protein
LVLNQNDLYWRTFSIIQLTKFGNLLSESQNPSEEVKANIQNAFTNAEQGALAAVNLNKQNTANFQALGLVYETAAPFSGEEMYKSAQNAYQAASALNPTNPGLKLDLARVALKNKDAKAAKTYADQALALKSDYIDAFLVHSQISLSENNRSQAISYAEQALALAPANTELQKYVTSLRSGGTPASTPESTEE